jgi:DNA modification methylase
VSVIILRGDAQHLPLPDASVDLVVTSPPYFGLRSYSDGGEHYAGQIGSEATPREFLGALLDCTREWVRVLKPSGSIFVNLGDKYASSGGAQSQGTGGQMADRAITEARRRAIGAKALREDAGLRRSGDWGIPNKSLMLLPQRYAIRCIDDLGLILRAEIVWAKPNGLPESVTDRVRRSHEDMVHFTKQPRYFAAVDEVREAHTGHRGNDIKPARSSNSGLNHRALARDESLFNSLGKLPGSVWEIPAGEPPVRAILRALTVGAITVDEAERLFTPPAGEDEDNVWSIPSQPLAVPAHLGVDHFAAFPMELPRRVILGWSPSGICTECGEGRRPVADKTHVILDNAPDRRSAGSGWPRALTVGRGRRSARRDITGYACACPEPDAPTRPAVVLDPFGGTGTTSLVADMHGRTGVTVDRSADYCRLAAWRTTDPGERARALGVPKPPPVPEGQASLFDLEVS